MEQNLHLVRHSYIHPTYEFSTHTYCSDVEDVTDVLEINVLDENWQGKAKADFLGKVLIPLLHLTQSEKRWYRLKGKKLSKEARGNHPEILLQFQLIWNP